MNIFSHHHKKVFIFMLIALAGLQASCGFHLRSALGLPGHITPIFLDLRASDDELGRKLQSLLSSSAENALAVSSVGAKTVLNISKVQKKQRVVAVDNLGRAREYELNYQFRYELKMISKTAAQSKIIKTNTVKLKRDLLFDPGSVLAVDHEKNAMYEDMRKDAAQLVLRQLSVIKQPVSRQK